MALRRRSRRSLSGLSAVVAVAPLAAGIARARDDAARRISGGRRLCPEDDCGYVDDPAKGDPTRNVPPGTALAELPEDRVRPWCGLPHERWL